MGKVVGLRMKSPDGSQGNIIIAYINITSTN
mgnify:CR=1 FL=1